MYNENIVDLFCMKICVICYVHDIPPKLQRVIGAAPEIYRGGGENLFSLVNSEFQGAWITFPTVHGHWHINKFDNKYTLKTLMLSIE